MPSRFRITYLILLPLLGGTLAWLAAANGSSNLRIDPAGAVTFSVEETGPSVLHRIEVSSGLRSWTALRTVASAGGNLQYSEPVDAAPEGRYYRAAPENDPRAIPGDHLATSDGDVVIHPVQHASFVLRWRDLILYNDPVGGAAPYAGLPPAGLILVGHQHGDHFNTATLDAVRAADAALVVPPDVFDRLTAAQRETAIVLANGEETEILGLHIAAVPAYNDRHPQGRDNGYVLTIANRRIYISGDTGPTPEMLALQEIDLAFLCMNVPFTMTVDQAAEALLAFRPRLVYPYHYRNQDGGFANLGRLRSLLGEGSGVQVKEGDWY